MIPVRATLSIVENAPQNTVAVQFNPQSLHVTYTTTGTAGSQNNANNTGKQASNLHQTGFSATLTAQLLFDTSDSGNSVQNTTSQIVAMTQPQGIGMTAVPIVLFQWGTFYFKGTIQSLDETLDFFSEQGVPLRSTMNLTMNQVELDRANASSAALGAGASAGAGSSAGIGAGISAGVSLGVSAGMSASASFNAGAAIGTTPLTLAQSGDTLQSLAGRAGVSASWKDIASANNIDNPRMVQPGTVLNLNAGASASVSASASVQGTLS